MLIKIMATESSDQKNNVFKYAYLSDIFHQTAIPVCGLNVYIDLNFWKKIFSSNDYYLLVAVH
jgi:hypothetical protein